MKIREYFENVIAITQPLFANSTGIGCKCCSEKITKIHQLLLGFNIQFSRLDLEPILSNRPEIALQNPQAIWRVFIPQKELYMKFSALGFNPPGGVAINKTSLGSNNILIDVIEDFADNSDCLVILKK